MACTADFFVRKALLDDLLRLLTKDTTELPDDTEKLLGRLASAFTKGVDICVFPACHKQNILHLLLNRKTALVHGFIHNLLITGIILDEVAERMQDRFEDRVIFGQEIKMTLELT